MTAFFLTHHSPAGAWASLTFGLPGRGVSIDLESLSTQDSGDLLVAFSRGAGQTWAMPFITPESAKGISKRWQILDSSSLTRTLTPCVDQYLATMPDGATMALRVYTPHPTLPNPKRSRNLQYASCPGLLIELEVDNSGSDAPATAFLGLNYRGHGRLRALDWSSRSLIGVGYSHEWAMATVPAAGEVFTIRDGSVLGHVATGTAMIRPAGNSGGVCVKVAPRSRRTVLFAFGWHKHGLVTQGVEGRYLYTEYFPRLESVLQFVLANEGRIREACRSYDARAQAACPDTGRLELFSQAVRGYYANTQLIDAATPRDRMPMPLYSVIEGKFGWRNTLDLAVDHLPWELYRNPWVVRNIFDLFTSRYSYSDQVIFPSEGAAGSFHDGGMSLTHDMGSYTAYSPAGQSGYEGPGSRGLYSYMTREQLLNAVYLLTSYALTADDNPWAKTRLPFARELFMSMANRDHHDESQRDGIMKGESILCGPSGSEITTYDSLDASLAPAQGNLVVAMKTFCANILLTTYFQNNNDLHSADHAYAMAQKTAATLSKAFDETRGIFPANLSTSGDVAVLAALEPLAVPAYLGLTDSLAEYFPDFMEKLKRHADSCLKPGVCVDGATGALRLTSSSPLVFPSKVILAAYVLEHVLGIDLASACPNAMGELIAGQQVTCADRTISDQLDVSQRTYVNGSYYPRLVTASVFVHPSAIQERPAPATPAAPEAH